MEKTKYKSAAATLSFINELAYLRFLSRDITLQYPNSLFSQLFSTFTPKIDWMYNQLVSSPSLNAYVPDSVRIIREKWMEDFTSQLATREKLGLLSEDQLNQLENVLDCLISGETISVELK